MLSIFVIGQHSLEPKVGHITASYFPIYFSLSLSNFSKLAKKFAHYFKLGQ